MPGDSFVDTNIWIYAHLRKPDDPRHGIALQFVENLTHGVISPQVVAEYYSVIPFPDQSPLFVGFVGFSSTYRKSTSASPPPRRLEIIFDLKIELCCGLAKAMAGYRRICIPCWHTTVCSR